MQPRIHDLLEIDTQRFLDAHPLVPAWVKESLRATPFVVVRRGAAIEGAVAVGVRGEERNQRWASSCDHRWITRVVTPRELMSAVLAVASESPEPTALSGLHTSPGPSTVSLRGTLPEPTTLSSSRLSSIPALRTLTLLSRQEAWQALPHPWGPGGSVGFELATGRPTAKPQSDLDVVIYAARRLNHADAKRLYATTQDLPSAVDVRVETPICGFSLAEYATRAGSPILLRLATGTLLGVDPWDGVDTSMPAEHLDPCASHVPTRSVPHTATLVSPHAPTPSAPDTAALVSPRAAGLP